MSARTRMSSPVARAATVVSTSALVAAALAMGATPAAANDGDNVTICHATASATHPYTVNRVDTSSIANLVNHNGHGLHADDIIPPFLDKRGDLFPGLNWDDTGQQIYGGGLCDGSGGGGGSG